MQSENANPPASADLHLLQIPYDLVVVGNDPAGFYCSREAAREGLRVLHLDSKSPSVLCPEWTLTLLSEGLLSPLKNIAVQNLILQDTQSLYYHRDDLTEPKPIRIPGKVYNRQVLDHALSLQARASNVRMVSGTFFRKRTANGLEVDYLGETVRIKTSCIVAADGVRSLVRAALGLESSDYLASLQYRVELTEPHQTVHFYGSPELTQGLGWFIPRGKTANVGFGVLKPVAHVLMFKLHQILDKLISKEWIEPDELSYKSGGLIPIGGPSLPPGEDGILLVGDAAGLRDTIVPGIGIGLGSACLGGTLAGQYIADEIRHNKRPRISGYMQSLKPVLDGRLKAEVGLNTRKTPFFSPLQKF